MKRNPILLGLLLSLSNAAYASDYFVDDTSTLENTLSTSSCGDNIFLNDGNYNDVQFTESKSCTDTTELRVTAVNPGSVNFTGDLDIDINGRYFELSGINFENGSRSVEGDLITVAGKKNRITNNKFSDFDDKKGAWIKLQGKYNRVDHNSFSGKQSEGSYINIDIASTEPSYHKVDYNYFTRPLLGSNGGSASRVGHGSMHDYNARVIFEYNLFENEDGESEIVSIKSSENIFRNNTFLNSRGHLSLRQGKRNVVIDNYFIGSGQTKETGVFVRGEDHIIFNNYFFNMTPTASDQDYGTVSFGASTTTPDQARAAQGLNPYHYPKTQNVFLLNNTIVKSKYSSIFIGSQYNLNDIKDRTTLPGKLYLLNNVIFKADNSLGEIQTNPDNVFFNNYIANITNNNNTVGFDNVAMTLKLRNGIKIPKSSAISDYEEPSNYFSDMEALKSTWNEYKSVKTRLQNISTPGFDFPTDSSGNILLPLTKAEVGTNW